MDKNNIIYERIVDSHNDGNNFVDGCAIEYIDFPYSIYRPLILN